MGVRTLQPVERWYDAVNRHDVVAIAQCVAPDVEAYPALVTPDGVLAEDVRGRDGLRRWFAALWEVWPDSGVQPLETMITPDGYVLAFERWHAATRDEMGLDFHAADLYEIRDDLIVRIDGFLDRAEALAAAGLT